MLIRRPRISRRRGVITLELILALPILLVAMFAVIQFAVFFNNIQQLALASRVGAEAASQIALPDQSQTTMRRFAHRHPVPEYVVDAVRQQLLSAGIQPGCVVLEHNVHPAHPHGNHTVAARPPQVFWSSPVDSKCECDLPSDPLPPNAVRLTVCVPLAAVMPNCLATFGFDIKDKIAQQTTVFHYEL